MNFRKTRARSRRNSVNIMIDTEKWKNFGRKMSRKTEYVEEESDDDKSTEMNWEQEFFRRKKLSECISDQDVEVQLTKKQTLLLSTLVPDEILLMEKFDSAEPKRFVGVLLMADVSGYTALSERYNNTGKGGTYRLTVTLNTYLGSLIEMIYNHGGDIIKFAGDAFLALWKTDKRTFLCHTIHTAIACALLIQHSFSSYETDVKVNLRVKLAISAGNIIFATIGNKLPMNYVIFGLPVIEAKLAESVCVSGEVKLTPNAWGHCYSRNYDHVIHEDGHVTIRSILYDPREKDVSKPFGGFGTMIKIKKPFCALENLPDTIWCSSNSISTTEVIQKHEALSFRKAILVAEDKNIGVEIRKFMVRPVLTQIDAQQPLEYLTEMRQVSVLFVTLKPRKCPYLQLITIVNNAYQIICEIVYKSMGCVNKIILFDKDVMMLVIFGLRGFKHECEAQAALKCAYSIKKSVSALDGVCQVSIGVTTGQVYCGVVGHPLRREFTVIGAIVNKAARLMCYFRNKITCDESTFVKSKMSTNGFTLQPKAELKGIMNPGKIYEYTEEIRVKELYDIPMIPPLLDRSDEMEYFENWLNDAHNSYRDFDALLLVGESRLGKSKLLEWMSRHASNCGFNTCHVSLTSIHSATPYLALTQIIDKIFGLKEPIVGFEKEEMIVQLLHVYDEDLCYLNDVLKVRFAFHEGVYTQDVNKRADKAKEIFSRLIQAIPGIFTVFLDDLHNLDPVSWPYIAIMMNSNKIFTVMTVRRGKFSSVHSWLYSVFINSNIRKIVLGSLAPRWIPPLACQILDVKAVPNDLCEALREKCKGLPGLVELFIVHLFSSGALEIKKMRHDELEDWKDEELQFPDPDLLHPQALKATDQVTLNKLIEDDKTEEISICIVTQKEELKTDINVQNLDALIMIQIDSLTPYQQLLLKIASVIGDVLSRDLLESIMYENNPLTTAKAVKRLFSMHILGCANTKSRWHRKTPPTSKVPSGASNTYEKHHVLSCECIFDYDPENSYDLPKYAFCKVMKFKNKKSRQAFYELLPLNQKKEFHARIVANLQNNDQKCTDCGGTVMIVQSTMSFDVERDTVDNIENIDEENSDQEEEVRNSLEENQQEFDNELRTSRSESVNNIKTIYEPVRSSSEANAMSGHNSMQSAISGNSVQFNPILKIKNSEDIAAPRRRSTKRVTVATIVYRNPSADFGTIKVFDMLREVAEAENISDWNNLGVVDSDDEGIASQQNTNKKFFSIKIEKGVSQTNFSKCSCAELKITIYEQLIRHANRADMKLIEIEYLIKLSYLFLIANNTDGAFLKLDDAETYCNMPIIQGVIEPCDIKRFLGKIYSLKTAANLMIGNLTAAKLAIGRATRIYRLNVDKVSEFFKMSQVINSLRIKRKKYRKHEALMLADSIFCLNVATLLFSALGDGTVARTCAYRALKLVRKVDCNVKDLCDVFSNALQVDLLQGFVDNTADTERLAIYTLQRLRRPIRAEDLYALGKLFMATFRARVARGQLAVSIHSGFRALTVSRFLHADNVSIDIIPELFYILLSRRRIEEAVDVVKETINLGHNQRSIDCESWYYAMCLDMVLDAGFQLEPPNEISRYAEHALYTNISDASRRRLVVGLWTYWLRVNQERKAKRFEAEALGWMGHEDPDGSLTHLISAMRLAEGMLESLARKVNDLRKVVDLMELRSLADRELIRLENDAKNCRAMYPRWIILKANTLYLSGRQALATTVLNQALEEARKVHNRLEEATALAATRDSPLWLANARSGRFLNWKEASQQARSSWHQLLYNMTIAR
ncbi:adenylate cyclase type 10-like [Choristoneura fumiferana]|uniref:adenylate cyclase type 10-like n=1 Tax=Choristoneura fumiferana TaxID=7141 RepID=UPI003D1598EA